MAFFLTLAYIAISIDASGIIRWLAFKVLQKAGKNGPRLYLYLYLFFLILASFIGNDPIILSGTAFLAYMTRVASNIESPTAWIYTQFAVANIGSAILVTSNPTNLVLSGAFNIRFIDYTANIIVPVAVTAIALLPFLVYIAFPGHKDIPKEINIHQLEPKDRREPVNPNIPYAAYAQGVTVDQGRLSLNEIMNPFLDKGRASFGAVIMAATLVTIIALNAASQGTEEHPVFWVTLPAAFIMFCWDLAYGWLHRTDTREIAREGRRQAMRGQERRRHGVLREQGQAIGQGNANTKLDVPPIAIQTAVQHSSSSESSSGQLSPAIELAEKAATLEEDSSGSSQVEATPTTLAKLIRDAYRWAQEIFPTVTAVLSHLPWKLVPFALAMFVLVQALATKGWVAVFAYGWDHWVQKTGTVGAIGGMGFLSVIMCNVSPATLPCNRCQPAIN